MIRRIRIQNFKSIRDVTVDLDPVTVLIGRSGTGKTNFCEAVRFLHDSLSSESNPKKQLDTVKPVTHQAETLGYSIDFSIDGYSEDFHYELAFQYGLGLAAECLAVSGTMLFAQSRDRTPGIGPRFVWGQRPPLTISPEPGKILLNKLPGLEYATAALSALTEGLAVYAFPLDVLEKNDQAGSDSLNARSVIQSLWINPQSRRLRAGIVAAVRHLNPSVTSIELDSIQQPKSVVIGHDFAGNTLSMPLSSESSGFRRFLAHLLAIYQNPSKQTLIFEEPENGIFPGALAVLAEEFKQTPEAGRGQVILTTHNPVLLNYFESEQIRVVEMNENLETQIGPLAADQQESIREKLMDAGELFTTDRPRREVVAQ